MISVRLSRELEEKLNEISAMENTTKSDIIKRALEIYIDEKYECEKTPYELGEDLFDKYGSGDGTLSQTYRQKVKEKINAKVAH